MRCIKHANFYGNRYRGIRPTNSYNITFCDVVYNTFPFLSFPFLVVAYSNKKAQLTSDTRATAVCVRRLVFATSTLFDAPSRGTPCDINAIYTSLKSTFSGLQFRRWQYETIFSCYCLRNTKNVAKFQENLTLQQFKVIQGHRFWCQWKAHITLAVSASVFEIFTLKDRKTADFTNPSLVWRLPAWGTLRISGWNLHRNN